MIIVDNVALAAESSFSIEHAVKMAEVGLRGAAEVPD